MYKIILISSLCVFLGSCFANIRSSDGANDSEVSSVSIKQPDKLPETYKNQGGYSLCVKRVNHSETGCSKSVLEQSKWNKTSVGYDLNNSCPSGYKIKMWLWKDEKDKTNKSKVYVLSAAKEGTGKYKDGYVFIGKEQLTGQPLTLTLQFRSGEDVIVSSGDSKDVEVNIIPTFDNGQSSDSSSNAKDTKETASGTNDIGSFDFTCDIPNETSASEKVLGNDKGLDNKKEVGTGTSHGYDKAVSSEPTGKIEEISSISEVKKGYPTLVVYTRVKCGACEVEEKNLKSIVGSLKGKMHVYLLFKTWQEPGSTPENVFYDKNAQKVANTQHYWSTTLDKIRELSK